MKCPFFKKTLIIGLFILSSVFFSQLFVSSSYAIDDITITYPAGYTLPVNTPLFPNCTGSCLSDYSYFIISSPNPVFSSTLFGFSYRNKVSHSVMSLSLQYSFSSVVFSVDCDDYSDCLFNSRTNRAQTLVTDLTFTLTNSLGSSSDCPVCEECQVCPVIPENPYDPQFDRIVRAIYVCGAIMLVLYFLFVLYRIIIKNVGRS